MNTLEKITSIIILSAIPYVMNAQTNKSEDILSSKYQNVLFARLDESKESHYNAEILSPSVETKKKINTNITKFPAYHNKFTELTKYISEDLSNNKNINLHLQKQSTKNLNEYIDNGLIPFNKSDYAQFSKKHILGHKYEYHLGKHAGVCFEEYLKYDEGFECEHFEVRLVWHLGK